MRDTKFNFRFQSYPNTIERERAARGWTQGALAERAGISRATISALETLAYGGIPSKGQMKSISDTTALLLADALEVAPEELFKHYAEAAAAYKPRERLFKNRAERDAAIIAALDPVKYTALKMSSALRCKDVWYEMEDIISEAYLELVTVAEEVYTRGLSAGASFDPYVCGAVKKYILRLKRYYGQQCRKAELVSYEAYFPLHDPASSFNLEEFACILDIDGAYLWTTVQLNGYQLVMHPHGYTPFLVDLTKRMKPGKLNDLTIITNAVQPSTRWYAGGGLYRDVFLWHGGDIRIEPWDLFISTPTLETAHAAYEIASDRDAEVLLKACVVDAEGNCVQTAECVVSLKAREKTPASLDFVLKNAHVWDVGSPYLYTLKTEISENGIVVETDEKTFGIRTVSVNAKEGFLLNGKSIKLRGGCIHHDHAVLGAADFPAACKRKLTLLQNAGFNALRIAHMMHPKRASSDSVSVPSCRMSDIDCSSSSGVRWLMIS